MLTCMLEYSIVHVYVHPVTHMNMSHAHEHAVVRVYDMFLCRQVTHKRKKCHDHLPKSYKFVCSAPSHCSVPVSTSSTCPAASTCSARSVNKRAYSVSIRTSWTKVFVTKTREKRTKTRQKPSLAFAVWSAWIHTPDTAMTSHRHRWQFLPYRQRLNTYAITT